MNEILNEHLQRPELRSFRAGGKLKFSEEMRDAFGSCVSSIHAVPVDGAPCKHPSYVLEIDVTPDSAVCGDIIFSVCLPDPKNKTKIVTCVRKVCTICLFGCVQYIIAITAVCLYVPKRRLACHPPGHS